MPMDKSMLDKMQMPKKPGEEDEMLAFSEEDMGEEGAAQASGMDLSSVSDDELMMEIEKRGLLAGQEQEDMSAESEAEEVDMEEEEA